MKYRIIMAAAGAILMTQSALARTVEVEVHGMTCAFCVDSLERKFRKMDSVSDVEISLKLKKIRLQTEPGKPTVDTIRKTVLDAGFTPVKVEEVAE
ncbi:MAG: hypothetical protein DSZ32_07230 [Gammaproteobacteria bacterium]|nr:MAG: hypothetical protein DSZ32_07230 [Gammaproteobacteria bacterium]